MDQTSQRMMMATKSGPPPVGTVWTYRDDLSKSQTEFGATNALAIAWTGTQFCVVGTVGRAATSPDGVTWTNRAGLSSTAFGTAIARAIAWTGTQFCVVGDNGRVATSA